MAKPKNKAEWTLAAKKLKVIVDKADTTKEIIKNIGDKLGISSRGANFENRVVAAMEKAIPSVPPSTEKQPEAASTKDGHVKLKFKEVVHERNLDVCLSFKGTEVWLNKNQIEMVSDSEVLMPDWLAELKKIS